MNIQLEAIFEQGVFRPLQPVELPEHQRVLLAVETAGHAPLSAPIRQNLPCRRKDGSVFVKPWTHRRETSRPCGNF